MCVYGNDPSGIVIGAIQNRINLSTLTALDVSNSLNSPATAAMPLQEPTDVVGPVYRRISKSDGSCCLRGNVLWVPGSSGFSVFELAVSGGVGPQLECC